jgi:hypothetical protein
MKGIHNAMAEREIEEKQWMGREKSEDVSDVSKPIHAYTYE